MKKNIIKTLSFFVVLVGISILLTNILTPKNTYTLDDNIFDYEMDKYDGFYKQNEFILDYIILGASHSYHSVNPMQIYSASGYAGYTLGSAKQPLDLSYYWLKEACKTQTPKYVFLDVSSLLYTSKDRDSQFIMKSIMGMKPSFLKAQAIVDVAESKDWLSYVMPMYAFHDRWKDLSMQDFSRNQYPYIFAGSYLNFNTVAYSLHSVRDENNVYLYSTEDGRRIKETIYTNTISAENKQIFSQILSFCEEEKIKLIPVKFPTQNWDIDRSNMIKSFLNQYNLDYMDLTNELFNINWEKDTYDSGFHTNYYGNSKTSAFISKYLTQENMLVDHRNTLRYEKWDQESELYRKFEIAKSYNDVEKTFEYLLYLDKIKNDSYIVFSVCDDAGYENNKALDFVFETIGLKKSFHNNRQNSYIAVLDEGRLLFEEWKDAPISINFNFTTTNGEANYVEATSRGFTYGNTCSISINGEIVSLGTRGLNVVVFDKETGTLQSSAALDIRESHMPFTARSVTTYDNISKLENGIYKIEPSQSNIFALTIPEDNSYIEDLYIQNSSNLENQLFEFTSTGGGLYTIKSVSTGKYLEAESFGNTNGTHIVQNEYTGLSNQQWFLIPIGMDTYSIMSHYNKLVMDLNGSYLNEGNIVFLWEDLKQPWQAFTIRKAKME